MEPNITWKEAKSARDLSYDNDDDEEEDETAEDSNGWTDEGEEEGPLEETTQLPDICSSDNEDDDDDNKGKTPGADFERTDPTSGGGNYDFVSSGGKFSHKQLDLKLRRNIINLAEASQEKPRPNFPTEPEAFNDWLENAHVAISPSADFILFASHNPEKLVFYAKLRMEPIDQYCTKILEIPTDYNEYVTGLLCIPIMSVQRTSLGSVDWTVSVIGMSSGYVKFYTEQSICLLSLKFCDEPIISLKCQTQKNNLNARSQTHFASIVDELLVTYRSCAIVIDGIGLYENLRLAKEDVVKWGGSSHYEPAYTLANLPTILTCVKVNFEEFKDTRTLDADLFGMRCTTRFDSLKSDSMCSDHVQAKSFGRTLVLVGQNPYLTICREAKEIISHSYTEIITSLFPLWNKPEPTKMQMHELSQTSNTILSDKGRLATSIIASPDRRLAAITDDFGRISLLDVTNSIIVRIWKGYRSAQCGWIEVKRDPDHRASPYATFLVIYAPKRGLLEIWSIQRGPRVAAFNVGRCCRVLYSGYKMLNIRAESILKGATVTNPLIDQSYSSNCYLLNAKTGTVFTIELPYTYSLYKYGDLWSRDYLFIDELTNAIQQDSDIKIISETLYRIVLAESIQTSIQKIASNLSPEKIVPIMENLVNKTMKNYDNDSGETITDDDLLIVNTCKRIILLCSIFNDLSKSSPTDIHLPEVNQRLIEEYEEHPQEVDEFAKQLNWTPSEVLRYLSLLTLERSYGKDHQRNPWPNMGEPLAWSEFISCFELSANADNESRRGKKFQDDCQFKNVDKSSSLSIKMKEFNNESMNADKVAKTAIFMYNRLSENFYKSSLNTDKLTSSSLMDNNLLNSYTYLEPASRLALLFHFWLSTKLCNHWKMWAFIQTQIGRISDELKVLAMEHQDDACGGGDDLLVNAWKQIFKLILESDNIFAALIATAAIRSDTLNSISDDEKRNKLEKTEDVDPGSGPTDEDTNPSGLEAKQSVIDWECLCIDAERMSMLSQQLEDVFLLNLLLRYSPKDGHLVDSYIYKVPRISVAGILRSGPTIVSEIVAQWAVQSNINLTIFKHSYGDQKSEEESNQIIISEPSTSDNSGSRNHRHSSRLFKLNRHSNETSSDEQANELLHHTKTSFPLSLEPNIILLNCIWEFCRRWTNSGTVSNTKTYLLDRALESLNQLESIKLKHHVASVIYKNFFQRTFERLAILIESNGNLLSSKSLKLRDALTRKELNMSEDCLEDFVQFCCNLSEFMLETCRDIKNDNPEDDANGAVDETVNQSDEINELFEQLSIQDDWWTTPAAVSMLRRPPMASRHKGVGGAAAEYDDNKDGDEDDDGTTTGWLVESMSHNQNTVSIVQASLLNPNLFDVNALVELNKLANLINLIFKLKITRAYPLSLIGEESRQLLRFDLQQSPTTGADLKTRPGSLLELRQKFARKCIVCIVAEMADETNEITEEEYGNISFTSFLCPLEDIDTGGKSVSRTTATATTTTISDNKNAHGINIGQQQQQQTRIAASSTSTATTTTSSRVQSANIATGRETTTKSQHLVANDADVSEWQTKTSSNETMLLFTNLLSLSNEWQLDRDELNLEFVFELYRCNLDKLAAQISNRVQDKQTLANGLLKIASQRVLVLFGLSPKLSQAYHWRRRIDKWSLFQPNVSSWLKSIQSEEMRRELAGLCLSESLRPPPLANSGNSSSARLSPSSINDEDDEDDDDDDDDNDNHSNKADDYNFLNHLEHSFGVQLFALTGLRSRTKLILESVTNYLDGQSARLAYDLLQVLESKLFERFIAQERKIYLSDRLLSKKPTKKKIASVIGDV